MVSVPTVSVPPSSSVAPLPTTTSALLFRRSALPSVKLPPLTLTALLAALPFSVEEPLTSSVVPARLASTTAPVCSVVVLLAVSVCPTPSRWPASTRLATVSAPVSRSVAGPSTVTVAASARRSAAVRLKVPLLTTTSPAALPPRLLLPLTVSVPLPRFAPTSVAAPALKV